MKTQALVLFETNRPLRPVDLSIPSLKPGQVLVKIAYSGVCHTQLGEVRGRRGPDHYLPHTLGHEGSGTVMEIGPGVSKVQPGDNVVLSWIKGCGQIVGSMTYRSSEGPINSGAISTFMKETVTSEACVTPIPANMPLREAALLGCAVPTGCGIVLNTLHLQAGQRIAIFGMGGVGLSAALFAAMMGASTIIAVDIIDEKLTTAKLLGATHVLNQNKDNVLEKIKEITGGSMVDYSVEAVGNPEVMALAFSSVKTGGGLCVIAGNAVPGRHLKIDPYDLIKGKRLIGTWGGETDMNKDIPLYVNHFLSKRLKLDQLISAEYRLNDMSRLLDDLEQGRIVRGLINMTA